MHKFTCLILAALLLLCGCGSGGSERIDDTRVPQGLFTRTGSAEEMVAEESKDLGPYVAPEYADAAFHAELALGDEDVKIDLSGSGQGYVGVSSVAEHRLKFQVIKDDATYNYDIASDGKPSIFPLQSGDGDYRFRVMENVVDSKYAEKYSVTVSVTLDDEFQPFLRPSDYVNYSRDSACVKKAAELAQTAGDALGLIASVYGFVCATVKYDAQKAATVQSGYLPDPDETMQSGLGICFDYASLAAAMLRSQGIPTKEIFGYVSPDGLYHAWNMIYTEETGWITVSYELRGDSWNRMDLTFSANGADSRFIGDGSNYSDLYFY